MIKAWWPAAAMCVVIFLLSQDPHSGRHSDAVLGWLLSIVGMNSAHLRHALDEPFRKFAHVVVYFLLGASAYYGFAMGRQWFYWPGAFRAVVFCAAYAILDEYHQGFVPGRGVEVSDVFLDTSACILALAVIWLWRRPRRKPRMAETVVTGADSG